VVVVAEEEVVVVVVVLEPTGRLGKDWGFYGGPEGTTGWALRVRGLMEFDSVGTSLEVWR